MVIRLLRGALNHCRGHLASQQLKRSGTGFILLDALTKLDDQNCKARLPCRVGLIEVWPSFAAHGIHARRQGRFLQLPFSTHRLPLFARALLYSVTFCEMEFKDRLCHVQELSSPRIIGTCAASGLALFYMSQARRAAASRVRPMQARKT